MISNLVEPQMKKKEKWFHAHRHFPSAYQLDAGATATGNGAWSVHAQLLPFCEQASAYRDIDFRVPWSDEPNLSSGVPTLRVPMYQCPSEINDTVRIKNGVHGNRVGCFSR